MCEHKRKEGHLGQRIGAQKFIKIVDRGFCTSTSPCFGNYQQLLPPNR